MRRQTLVLRNSEIQGQCQPAWKIQGNPHHGRTVFLLIRSPGTCSGNEIISLEAQVSVLEVELEEGMGLICAGRGSLARLIQGVRWGCWTGLCKVVLPQCQGLCFCSLCQMGAAGSGERRGEKRQKDHLIQATNSQLPKKAPN